MSLVFVYGTLKRGCDNHSHLSGQRFIGEARTVPGHVLYELTGYPGMVAEPGSDTCVVGELWEVDAAALVGLDLLEGVAEGLYRRARVALAGPHDGLETETYFYLRSLAGRRRLGSLWRP